jgi:hypothetical protein
VIYGKRKYRRGLAADPSRVQQLVIEQQTLSDRAFNRRPSRSSIGEKVGRFVRRVFRLVVHVLPAGDR